jgi:hypothetical protein
MNTLNLTNAALPQYTMTLPVSGITTKFRPFVVKEEKVLLVALQSKSMNQINDAMRNVILACTNNSTDTRRLCVADAEYAFLQIRSKSVGEEVKPQVVCAKCGKDTSIKIRLDEVTIKQREKPAVDGTVVITDNLSLVLRYPSIHDINHDENEVEIAFDLAKKCIESVVLNDQVHETKDINPQELSNFVDNMLPDQFAKIMDYLQSVPELHYEFKYTCPHCKTPAKAELKSVSDFFQ